MGDKPDLDAIEKEINTLAADLIIKTKKHGRDKAISAMAYALSLQIIMMASVHGWADKTTQEYSRELFSAMGEVVQSGCEKMDTGFERDCSKTLH